jgi:hypothetical protein
MPRKLRMNSRIPYYEPNASKYHFVPSALHTGNRFTVDQADAAMRRYTVRLPEILIQVEQIRRVIREKLGDIPEVEKVYSSLDKNVLRFWIVIDTDDRESERQVYQAEGDIYRQFEGTEVDFLVVNRRDFDNPPEEIIPTQSNLIYSAR